jgi:DNA polymerase III subunit delta
MIYKSYLVEQNISLINENLILFYGENLGLKNEFKKIVKLNNENIEIINFNQEEILKKPDIFYNEILNISLFEKRKIYFINNANDKILEIIKDIEPKIDAQKLYVFSEILDKRSKLRGFFEKGKNCALIACYADNESTIKKIILNKLNKFSGLSTQNINLILEKSGLDRVKLNNELEKIIIFFTNHKIENKKLELLLDKRENNDFNLLKDEAFNGNKIKTNKLLSDTIIENEKNILYLSIINQKLNKLADIFELSKTHNFESAISIIKPPIFWKDKPAFINQIKKWNTNKVKHILQKTYNLEIDIKSNPIINKNILMKKLIIDICEMANA